MRSPTTEERLKKARERREEMDRSRENALNDKYRQAIIRAQQNIEGKRERSRQEISRVAKICAERTVLEEKERRLALASIENKLNGAVSRAQQMSKKKQAKARRNNRAERARKRREISEFERRSALLSSVDRRTNLAEKNLQHHLLTRQCKAREEIQHAVSVSRKVRSARILQRAVRKMLGTVAPKNAPILSEYDAAVRLQFCFSWRLRSVSRRLRSSPSKESPSPLTSLQKILSQMGISSNSKSSKSFEDLTSSMTDDWILKAAQDFLSSFDPVLGGPFNGGSISERTLMSAFLVSQQPFHVLGPKRGKDACSRLLEVTSQKLTNILSDLANAELSNFVRLIPGVTACLLSYSTLFDKWKKRDIEELVVQMKKSAVQSWMSYLISKEALSYAEEKAKLVKDQYGDPFFQHNIRYKSSKKGATSHVKRIRASLEKLIGNEEGLRVMKEARQSAISRIKEDELIKNAKDEIDNIVDAHMSKKDQNDSNEDDNNQKFDLNDLDALESVNEHVVHEILLADKEGLRNQLCGNQGESIADCVHDFMDKFRTPKPNPSSVVTAEDFAFTMERAFFDKILDDWSSTGDMSGVKEMLIEMFAKMRNLVPKRKDLHDFFTSEHANNCQNATSSLALLLRVAEVMGDSLESPYRAESTLDWHHTTRAFTDGKKSKIPFKFQSVEAFVVGSIAFLIKKLDLCHADLVNFRLVKVTPLILQNGVQYERQRFQQKHGLTTENLLATKEWVQRMGSNVQNPSSLSCTVKEAFVDELLFVKERISMPEVLVQDSARINNIRTKVQRAVLSASLFLHAFNISNSSSSTSQYSKVTISKMNHYNDDMLGYLKGNLPHDDLCEKAVNVLVLFAQRKFGRLYCFYC